MVALTATVSVLAGDAGVMAMLLIVGALAVTVSVKAEFVVSEPSLTVIVIVLVPVWFVAGVMVAVRLAPLPPKTMFEFGTSVVLEDVPLTVSEPAAVSASPTVNAMAAVAVFCAVV
jgi:hypothetical protein